MAAGLRSNEAMPMSFLVRRIVFFASLLFSLCLVCLVAEKVAAEKVIATEVSNIWIVTLSENHTRSQVMGSIRSRLKGLDSLPSVQSAEFLVSDLTEIHVLILRSQLNLPEVLRGIPGIQAIEAEKLRPLPKTLQSRRLVPAAATNGLVSAPAGTWFRKYVSFDSKALHGFPLYPVKVGLLDSGVDEKHPYLVGAITAQEDFLLLRGRSPSGEILPVEDEVGHGTALATVMVGASSKIRAANGAVFSPGVQAQFYSGRICFLGGCSITSLLQGLNWMLLNKVDVLNLSMSVATLTQAEIKAFEAVIKKNVIIVASSGNDFSASLPYPASMPSVISVGAVGESLRRSSFSNYGLGLTLVAPGESIPVGVPSGKFLKSEVTISSSQISPRSVKSTWDVRSIYKAGTWNSQLINLESTKWSDLSKMNLKNEVVLVQVDESQESAAMAGLSVQGVGVALRYPPLFTAGGTSPASLPYSGTFGLPVVSLSPLGAFEVVSFMGASKPPLQVSVRLVPSDEGMMDGTSVAAPWVTISIGLFRSLLPGLGAAQVREILEMSAIPLSSQVPNEVGAGLLNLSGAIEYLKLNYGLVP